MSAKAMVGGFAEMLGNFQHNPGRAMRVVKSVQDMTAYLRCAIRDKARRHDGLIGAFLAAEQDGDRLNEEEVIANTIITRAGGQETTTNLIGNGLLTLFRHPEALKALRNDPALLPSAGEEMLRFERPSQHNARVAPSDCELGGKSIRRGQAVIAVMASANRDPERFPDPERFDITRADNRHRAFDWAAHFCFEAALARIEGQVAIGTILRRLHNLRLEALELEWRPNLGLGGLTQLPVSFDQRTVPEQVAANTPCMS